MKTFVGFFPTVGPNPTLTARTGLTPVPTAKLVSCLKKMRLEREKVAKYGPEISDLYRTWLQESPTNGLTYFGVFDAENLKAVGAVRCYMGHWYLRAFVVKPEYRGQGLQRLLIRECLEYLSEKTDTARISVFPDNFYSIRNIEAEGFEFEKKKKLEDGNIVVVYKKHLKTASSRNS